MTKLKDWAVAMGRQSAFPALMIYSAISLLLFGTTHSWSSHLLGHGPDPLTYIWGLNWWPWAIEHGINPMVSRYAWHPSGFHTAWADLVPGGALLGLPLTLLGNAVVAYNTLMMLAPALGAWCCFLLTRYLTKDPFAALLSGYLFGFSSYELGQMLGQLSLVLIFPVPLILWLAIFRVSTQIGRRRFIALLTSLLLLQFGFSLEVFATVYVAGSIAWLAALVCLREHRKQLCVLAADICLATVILVAITTPWLVSMYEGRSDVPDIVNLPAEYGADLMNFIVPTKVIQFGGAAFEFVSVRFHGNWSEQGSYLGLPLVAMVAASLRSHKRVAVSRVLLITMIVFVVLSLGPVIRIFGNQIEIWAPWQLVLELPLIRHALPSRLSAYIALLAAIATGFWLAAAQNPRSRTLRYGFCLLAIVFLLPDLQWYQWTPIPFLPFFERKNIEQLFGAVPNLTVLPLVPFPNTIYPTMIWQFQSGMAYTQTGGYLGNLPPETSRWPATSQLAQGAPGARFGKDIEMYAATLKITAIVAGPGTQDSLLHALDELGWRKENVAGVRVFFPSSFSSVSSDK
jgi:hypothetical protein